MIAFALIIVFSFAFEWVFITFGLFASNAQAAQGLALLLVPLTFVSSAYVTVSSMPGWLQAFAANQPVTYMIDAARSLTGGAPAEALLGHPASYFVVRSLIWTAAIVLVFATIGVARYRLDDEKGDPDVCLPGFAKSELERVRDRGGDRAGVLGDRGSAARGRPLCLARG